MEAKGLRKMAIILACIFTFCTLVIVYYFGAHHIEFDQTKREEFLIPDLDEGFIPQGLEYVAEDGVYLVSGYMTKGRPSRIYMVDKEGNSEPKFITLIKDGKDYTSHAGGIKKAGGKVFVAGDKWVEVVDYSDIKETNSGGQISVRASFKSGNAADFLSIYNDYLIVGEFYRKNSFETDKAHEVVISAKEINHALAYAYKLSLEKAAGVEEELSFAISLPKEAQGVAFNNNGELVLSSSYSLPSSNILVYENVLDKNAEKSIMLNDREVPLYILSTNNIKKAIKAPCMSEELVFVDGRLVILFESATIKYKLITRTRLKYAYSIVI